MPTQEEIPVFTAVTSSTKQLHSLLKCLGFEQRAHVQVSHDGLRITVEESRVMQAHAFVDRNLFSTFTFAPPKRHSTSDAGNRGSHPGSTEPDSDDESGHAISFGISLTALLECLQIFGAETARERWQSGGGSVGLNPSGGGVGNRSHGSVFDQQVLRVVGSCKLSYVGEGHPLFLNLEENGVITTCELATTESEQVQDIPLARESLALKVIMKASWLHDAIQELEGSAVERLIIVAGPAAPYFSLSATGPLGSTFVEFSNDKSLMELFQAPDAVQQTYKFGLIKYASKVMAIASKFMIEYEGVNPCFIDFRYLPYANDSDEED